MEDKDLPLISAHLAGPYAKGDNLRDVVLRFFETYDLLTEELKTRRERLAAEQKLTARGPRQTQAEEPRRKDW